MKAKTSARLFVVCGVLSAVGCLWSGATVAAEEWPSLFRGTTVGEGQPGVTVVFLRDDAFALYAGLRAGDHIVAIDEEPVNSLDDFAVMSRALAGKRTDVPVTVVRAGARITATLSLESPTVRSAWGLAFIPDYSLRFVDPKAAKRYWSDRGAKELLDGHDVVAMRSLLNALHYAPESYDVALALCESVMRQGETLWKEGQRAEALGVLKQAMALYRQAATKPLTAQHWARIKRSLQQLLRTLAAKPSTHVLWLRRG